MMMMMLMMMMMMMKTMTMMMTGVVVGYWPPVRWVANTGSKRSEPTHPPRLSVSVIYIP